MSMKINLFDGKIKAVVNMGKIKLPRIETKTVLISDKSKIIKRNIAIYSLENEAVKKMINGNDVTEELIKSDSDVDMNLAGKFIIEYPLTHILLDSSQNFVYDYQDIEVIKKPDGSILERPLKVYEANLNIPDNPIRLTKNFVKRIDFSKKYVVKDSYQIYHKDNLGFNYLFELAKNLDEMDSLVSVVSTEKVEGKIRATKIVVKTGGSQRLGFLEGRVKNANDPKAREYALILHLVELELTNIDMKIDVGESVEEGEGES